MKDKFAIEEYVTLTSYSDSPGWLGYYERRTKFSKTIMCKSINKFIDFFRVISPEVSVVTSLYKFDLGGDEITPDQKTLIESGYLKGSMNETLTLYSDIDWEIVRKLSSIVMYNEGDVAGHCFFILESLGLIAYPHDDTGYGFIAMVPNQHTTKAVKDFFECLDKGKFAYYD